MQRRFVARYIASLIVALFAGTAPAAEWQPIFNGKDLSGWNPVGKGDNWFAKD